MKNCLQCNKETKNPKFCSKSCSASYNNVRRKPTKQCRECEKPISHRYFYCSDECRRKSKSKRVMAKYYSLSPSERISNFRRSIKKKAVDFLGGKCIICGYDKSVSALHFHHTDPTIKKFCISGSLRAFEKTKEELKKCILVCSNCHAELHDKMRC